MASQKRIKIMLSSRNNDPIQFKKSKQTLTDLRKKIKAKIEQYEPFGDQLFECWINEDAPPTEGTEDSWEVCLRQVKECDLLIVLYNGNAGWAKSSGEIGICHAELATGLDTGRAKVYLIELPDYDETTSSEDEKARNKRFRAFKDDQSQFRGQKAAYGEDVLELVDQVLHEAVVNMFKLGVREARKGKFDTGEALDWNRLTLVERKNRIEAVMRESLHQRPDSIPADDLIIVQLDNKSVLCKCHGVPASMSTTAAREMVGRPFIKDFEYSERLQQGDAVGPVHFIGCHKGVTETQAVNLIGHPDVTVVSSTFGVYVADNYQMIQLLLLANCRDETSTRHAVQRAFEWLLQSGEEVFLCARAEARKNIIYAIAQEAMNA